jgi:SET domain-containing protein
MAGVMRVNCFPVGGHAADGLLSWAALMNHSCQPNCMVSTLAGDPVRVLPLRELRPREELLVDYTCGLGLSLQEHASYLQREWGINCTCSSD